MDPWIQTYTGKKFFPLNPRAEDVCLEDIAHALSMKCRFTGHTKEFYSVAQHSVLVSEIVASEDGTITDQLAALCHDGCEAYGPDFAAPVKPQYWVQLHGEPSLSSISTSEVGTTVAIHEALGIPFDFDHALVKKADLIMLMTEARDLMGPPVEPWQIEVPYLWSHIFPFTPSMAKKSFIARASALFAQQRAAQVLSHPTTLSE